MSHHSRGMKRSVTRKRDNLSRIVLILVLCLVFSADAFGREIVKTVKPANFFEFRGKVVDLAPSTPIEPQNEAFSTYKTNDDRSFAQNLFQATSKRKLLDLKPNAAASQEKSKTALAATTVLQEPESVVKQTLEGCVLKVTSMLSHSKKVASRSWWCVPILLSLIPMYTHLILDTVAMMPHWWQVVKMETTNLAVVTFFLLSNLSYFVTGGYLCKRFPMIERRKVQPLNRSFKWLGFWLVSSGLISTIFHSVQALGCYKIANSLCYIDHAIAITAGLYWVHTCGLPSKNVWLLGLPALGLLGIPSLPCYEWAHSSWHLLSAAAAYVWAIEGHHRRAPRV